MTGSAQTPARFIVVGIGADGWDGLGAAARAELSGAATVYGSPRQLDLVAAHIDARRQAWRSPMSAHLDELVAESSANGGTGPVHLLASGDPMFHGVGASLVQRAGTAAVRVLPAPSSASLAAARLGWDLARIRVSSLVTTPAGALVTELGDRRRLLVLSRDAQTPHQVADLLCERGFGRSRVVLLENLGGPQERICESVADAWHAAGFDVAALNIVAVECSGPGAVAVPGRDDTDFSNDGQLTKQTVRAVTVCALRPSDGQVLWDVGAGSGSIAIEWLLAAQSGRAVAFEASDERAQRIRSNAQHHGVAHRLDIRRRAPQAFAGERDPDTVFIGGGLNPDMFDAVWHRLRAGGRLVVNAVTVENQTLAAQLYDAHGGVMTRICLETAAPLGTMTTWRPALPVVQWAVAKP